MNFTSSWTKFFCKIWYSLYCSKGDNDDDVETKKQCQKAPGAIFNINYKEDNKQANSVRQYITERRRSTINSSQSHTAKTSIAQSFFFTERLAHMVVAHATFITNTHYQQWGSYRTKPARNRHRAIAFQRKRWWGWVWKHRCSLRSKRTLLTPYFHRSSLWADSRWSLRWWWSTTCCCSSHRGSCWCAKQTSRSNSNQPLRQTDTGRHPPFTHQFGENSIVKEKSYWCQTPCPKLLITHNSFHKNAIHSRKVQTTKSQYSTPLVDICDWTW